MGFVNAFMTHGYQLVSVILNDALFVRHDQAKAVGASLPHGELPSPRATFRSGYVDWPQRSALFPWNNKRSAWIDEKRPLQERARLVQEYLTSNGDGEALGYNYPWVTDAKLGVWPCVPKGGSSR